MLVQARDFRYKINKRKVTYETFTKHFKLAELECKLVKERQTLEDLPGNNRRRQREKVWRIEQQIDLLKLELVSEN